MVTDRTKRAFFENSGNRFSFLCSLEIKSRQDMVSPMINHTNGWRRERSGPGTEGRAEGLFRRAQE
jgi:hypothetical protein